MDLKPLGYIHECFPPVLGNSKNGFSVKLRLVPKPDFDAQEIHQMTLSIDSRQKNLREFIDKYFHGISGLSVDGEEVKTLDDIFSKVPMELYSWIYAAILSHEVLTKAELKN